MTWIDPRHVAIAVRAYPVALGACQTRRVAYEDLTNFVVFRKVFGQHPRVLVGLLNDLLEREGSTPSCTSTTCRASRRRCCRG